MSRGVDPDELYDVWRDRVDEGLIAAPFRLGPPPKIAAAPAFDAAACPTCGAQSSTMTAFWPAGSWHCPRHGRWSARTDTVSYLSEALMTTA